jgi:hypothetical protein
MTSELVEHYSLLHGAVAESPRRVSPRHRRVTPPAPRRILRNNIKGGHRANGPAPTPKGVPSMLQHPNPLRTL